MESGQGGWVTAGAMHGDAGHPNSADLNAPLSFGAAPADGGGMGGMGGSAMSQPSSEGIEAWFAVEPAGDILLNLNFGKFVLYPYPFILNTTCQSRKMSANAKSMHPLVA